MGVAIDPVNVFHIHAFYSVHMTGLSQCETRCFLVAESLVDLGRLTECYHQSLMAHPFPSLDECLVSL